MHCLNTFWYVHTMKYSEVFRKNITGKDSQDIVLSIKRKFLILCLTTKETDMFAYVQRPRMVSRNTYFRLCKVNP